VISSPAAELSSLSAIGCSRHAAGGQTVVHPTLGTIQSVCCPIERRNLGRAFEIRLTLSVSGNRLFPNTTVSTAAASTDAIAAGHGSGAASSLDCGWPVSNWRHGRQRCEAHHRRRIDAGELFTKSASA